MGKRLSSSNDAEYELSILTIHKSPCKMYKSYFFLERKLKSRYKHVKLCKLTNIARSPLFPNRYATKIAIFLQYQIIIYTLDLPFRSTFNVGYINGMS